MHQDYFFVEIPLEAKIEFSQKRTIAVKILTLKFLNAVLIIKILRMKIWILSS